MKHRFKSNLGSKLATASALSAALLMQACAKSDSASTASTGAASISGTLADASSTSSSRLARGLIGGDVGRNAKYEGSTVSCANPDGELVGEGTVASDGTFTVAVDTKQALSCSVVNTSGTSVANFLFENPDQKGLDGNNLVTDSVQLSGNAALGEISVDETSGNATADMSNFASSVAEVDVTAADVVALTGHYVITKVDIPEAAKKLGYQGVKTEAEMQAEREATGQDKGGPPDQYPLFLKIVHGTNATGGDVYGMLVWQHQDAFDACGSVVGATEAEIKADLGVTLDGNAGDFKYAETATISGKTHTLTDGWKSSLATSSWTMNDCGPYSDGKTNGWACYDGTSGARQIGRGGGCNVKSTGKPADVDWQNMNWSNAVCVNSTTADGYTRNDCTHGSAPLRDGSKAEVVCINEWKIEKPVDKSVARESRTYTAGTESDFRYENVAVKLAQGALCSTATDELTALQCYSNYYYENGIENSGATGACMKRIDTNWTASTAAEFVKERGPAGMHVRALGTLGLNGAGQPSLTGLSYNVEYRGVRVQNGSSDSYVPCKVGSKEKLSISKGAVEGELIATYESFSVNLTTDAPACANAFDGTPERFMFKFVAVTGDKAKELAAGMQGEN